MSLFRKESATESEPSNENQESMISKFTGWVGRQLGKADRVVSREISPEGGAIGEDMNRLFNKKMDGFKDAVKFTALATPLIAILALNGGKLALSTMIPGMEHMAMGVGMVPDDLASIPASLIDSLGHFLHAGTGVEAVAGAVPHVDVPVAPEVAPAPAPVEQIEFSDGDGGSGTAHYAYEKPVHGQEGDGFTLVNKDDESNFGQNPFKPENNGSSDKYEELVKSMRHFDTDKPSTPEVGATDASVDKGADAPAGTTPEEQHAETIKTDVEKAFTPGTAEEHAKTAQESVSSAFTPGTAQDHAQDIQSGVESHFGGGGAPTETAKDMKAGVESAFTPGTKEEHAKDIAESVFKKAA